MLHPRSLLVGATISLSVATSAAASPILWVFTGTALVQEGIYVGQGASVSGFLTYDSTLVDNTIAADYWDQFTSSSPAGANDPVNDVWEISITNGAVTRTSADNQRAVGGDHHDLTLFDTSFDDSFIFRAQRILATDDLVRFALRDGEPVPQPDGIAAGFGNLTGTPWAAPLDLDSFTGYPDSRQGTIRAYDDSTGIEIGYLEFHIDTMTLVPEPGTLVLGAAGLLGLALVRDRDPRRRVRGSA